LNRNFTRGEYNDIDGEVANFFRVLRDNKDELVEKIGLTPFARRNLQAVTKNPVRVEDRLNVQDFSTHERVKLAQSCPNGLFGRWRTVRIRAELECRSRVRWLERLRLAAHRNAADACAD